MAKKLDRELGLFSVFSISCGAMLGPGLFVLPGLAYLVGGPSVILAYITAGLLVIPAALSKAEMSTALPESGGPYLFLDRSLGPLAGTITGLGTWISLILKSAFSLIGVGVYLMFFLGFYPVYGKYVALVLGVGLILLNVIGGNVAGQLQNVMVVITIFVLVSLIGIGGIEVEKAHYHPFFETGFLGFLGATAFVIVSFPGPLKIVSVAEEIKNPGENIPWGIMLSLIVTILIYTLVVYVVVGVVPSSELGKGSQKLLPLAQAEGPIAGYLGIEIISAVASIALLSMANAGLMAASRFPLPMAREKILPDGLSEINQYFSTPLISILVTGFLLLVGVYFLPVKKLAKLASVFILLVFAMSNLAVIVFRESDIEWYKPTFSSPLYPYLQLAGFLCSLGLIFFMGLFPVLGTLVMVLGSTAWYFFYVRGGVQRKGAFFQTGADEKEIELFRRTRSRGSIERESVIVPFFGLKEEDALKIERRIKLAAALCEEEYRLDVVDFVEVPEQAFLSDFEAEPEAFESLKERVKLLSNEIESEIHVDQIITHDARGAITNYASDEKPHWVVFDWKEPSPWRILIGIEKWWLEDFPCDTLFFKDQDKPNFDEIYVVSEPGPYDGELVYAADHIASFFDSDVTFLNPVESDDENEVKSIEAYHQELKRMMDWDASSRTIPKNEWRRTLIDVSGTCDLILTGGEMDLSFFREKGLVDRKTRRQLECNFARIRSNLKSPESVLASSKVEDVNVEQFLLRDRSIVRLDAQDKRTLFRTIAETFGSKDGLTENIEDCLWEREKRQNTYLENGVALPHGISEEFSETRLRIFLLENPVSYTPNGDEVSICAVTVGPPDSREVHLQLLRVLSSLLIQETFRNELFAVSDSKSLKLLISSYL